MYRSLLAAVLLTCGAFPSPSSGAAWTRYYVIDARLSTLRSRPALDAPLLKRLRVGRAVYEVARSRDAEGRLWLRVAVTRRTRGWILAEAAIRPGDREGEQRVERLLETLVGFDRIEVARVAADHCPRLRAAARAALDEEADAAALVLSERAARRLGSLGATPPSQIRALMLSDAGLDRYNRLGIFFDLDPATRRFVPRRSARHE